MAPDDDCFNRIDDAQRLLARLLPGAEAAGRMGRVLAIGVLQARAALAQGLEHAALATLERALAFAEPEGYVRTFVDHGAPMARLPRQIADRRSPVAAYAAQLTSAFSRNVGGALSDETWRQGAPATQHGGVAADSTVERA